MIQLFLQQAQMADVLRDNGKIFVVVGVITIALLGVLSYLIYLDRRITKIEKDS